MRLCAKEARFRIGFQGRQAGEQTMEITKAVITAAKRTQRRLPLQMIIDRDGVEKSVLRILVEEVIDAGIDEICVIIHPGDMDTYAETVGEHAGRLQFVQQAEPKGYAHAVYCARAFVGRDPFLHMVGDHLYISPSGGRCATRVMEVARARNCSVSAVQATRETLLPLFGTIGGHRLSGQAGLYQVGTVVEKPTPTEAEQRLVSSGLRAGHYLCFFGLHVLTATVMDILGGLLSNPDSAGLFLSAALHVLAQREQYLALEQQGMRFDIEVKYGLLSAQIALALNGQDRDEMLTRLLELMMIRSLQAEEGVSLPSEAQPFREV